MKTTYSIISFSLLSLCIMVVVDYIIGEKAEFINAYSVLQRFIGERPTAGTSMIANQYGVTGELIAVIMFNLLAGILLTYIWKFFLRDRS